MKRSWADAERKGGASSGERGEGAEGRSGGEKSIRERGSGHLGSHIMAFHFVFRA
jgi:hypothetical protein